MKAKGKRRDYNSVDRFQKALKTRWLNGVEYLTLLTQHERLARILKIPHFFDSNHPNSIYFSPDQLPVYFLLIDHIDNLGFSRPGQKKIYVWKKLNLVTSIPKQNPLVKYVVATCTGAENNEEYKMHIIWNAQPSDPVQKQLVVCHVMKQSSISCKLKMTSDLDWKELATNESQPPEPSLADNSHFKLSALGKLSADSKEVVDGPERAEKPLTSIRKKFIFQPASDSLNVGHNQTPAEDSDLGKREVGEGLLSIQKIVMVKHTEQSNSQVTDIFGPAISHESASLKHSMFRGPARPNTLEADCAPKNLFRSTLPEPVVFDKSEYLAWIREKLDSLNSS